LIHQYQCKAQCGQIGPRQKQALHGTNRANSGTAKILVILYSSKCEEFIVPLMARFTGDFLIDPMRNEHFPIIIYRLCFIAAIGLLIANTLPEITFPAPGTDRLAVFRRCVAGENTTLKRRV
jgi:hypothetical protein